MKQNQKWKGKGLIPNQNSHLLPLANLGYATAKAIFNVDLYYHQALIFYYGILPDSHYRLNIITTTRYGKTFTLSLIALYRARFLNDKVLVVSHNTDTANLITTEVSKNLMRSADIVKEGLTPADKFERLAIEVSKNGITYPTGGSIHSVSLHEGGRGSGGIGFGATCLLIDESALVNDEEYSIAVRMALESQTFKKIEISNPHKKNHFYRSISDKTQTNIVVDAQTALEETRINPDQVEELRATMTSKKFEVFVNCKFTDDNDVESVFRITKTEPHLSKNITISLGIDLGRYNDSTVLYGLDKDCKATLCERWTNISFEVQKPRILDIWAKLGYPMVYLDMTGLGQGVFDSLKPLLGNRLEGIKFNNSIKLDLIDNAQLLIENGTHLLFDDPELIHQHKIYQKQETKTGLRTFNAPAGEHDDCVIAVALALHEFRPSKQYRALPYGYIA